MRFPDTFHKISKVRRGTADNQVTGNTTVSARAAPPNRISDATPRDGEDRD
jgi:hypothetical protein